MSATQQDNNNHQNNIPNSSANSMWGGHFDAPASAIMQEINESISFDKLLYQEDIEGSVAHTKMLAQTHILTDDEAKLIIDGLLQVKAEIESGKFQFREDLEDIHMNIENRLKEIIGDIAGKMHTARSRNDQVATDFKLYIRNQIDNISQLLTNLQKVLISKAEENITTIIPGFTHLQSAQPISFAHHLLAYVEMFKRDLSRLRDNRKRLNQLPLGSAALAGTSFPIDRDITAQLLDFDSPTQNSLDTVSDRDFAIEFLANISLTATHLSRLSEEIVIWCSQGFNFIKLSDQFTSGSSIMPQKRNPDAAELIRAKVGRINGNLVTLLTVMKALPLAYSKDMQEDKEPVFDSVKTIILSLKAMIGMISDMQINQDRMYEYAGYGFSTATDIADWLVKNLGIPFRDSHKITGKIVKIAESKKCRLDQLGIHDFQSIEPRINQDIYNVLSIEKSVESRNSFGGTSFSNIKKILEETKKSFE